MKKKRDDYVVCAKCGDEHITEEAWININDCITIEGKAYYSFSEEIWGDTESICESCNDVCEPIHITEYKEKK